ncbi:MAG: PilX N-terminal domain-containing pilus assembly protein [Pyrinomonadaceae bacterium]
MRIEKKNGTWQDERGASLVIALISLLLLGVLTSGIIFVTVAEIGTTANYKELAQARYAAEAGVQSTINWLANNYTAPAAFSAYNTSTYPVRCVSGCASTGPVVMSGISGVASNYPESSVVAAYRNALSNQTLPGLGNSSYSTSVRLLSMTRGTSVPWLDGNNGTPQTWEITSQGYAAGVRNATVQVVATYEKPGVTIFGYGVFATGNSCPTINMAGGAVVDSYDSSAGTYAATVQTTGGNVGSNGSLALAGNAAIYGNAYLPNVQTFGICPIQTFSNTSNVGISGNGGMPIATGSPQTFSDPSYTNPSPALTTISAYTHNVSLPPGNYNNVQVSAGKTLTLSPGTYNFNSLTLSGNSDIVLNSGGPVVVQIAGAGLLLKALDISGGTITNSSGVPANLQIIYSGSLPMTLSGGASTAGVVYAPDSAITMSGQAPWFGSIIGRSFNNSGGAAIHFDRSLATGLVTSSPYRLIGFTWSKF